MLDVKYPDKYCVANLGEGGATLQQAPWGDSPYWKRGSFKKLTSNKWDFVVIMLGTNDAKDACGTSASFCNSKVKPPMNSCCNWPHAGQTNWTQDCSSMQCPFVEDYAKLLTLVKTLGKTNSTPPKIWLAAPPPLMNGGSPASPDKPYGMNQTVINDIFPALLPRINSANGLTNKVIDVFGAMGGTSGLECGYAKAGAGNNFLCSHKCVSDDHTPACSDQCDKQSCDPCHPNDSGYTVLAAAVMEGMGL